MAVPIDVQLGATEELRVAYALFSHCTYDVM